MRVKRKDLGGFFEIVDLYFCSFGQMSETEYKFVDYFINKYKLENASQTEMWKYIEKIAKKINKGKKND